MSSSYKDKKVVSKIYWDNRYKTGGNSGSGSYGRLAKYKADVVNKVASKYNISEAIELGSGDGNQCNLFNFKKYIGIDISNEAVIQCKQSFYKIDDWEFINYEDPIIETLRSPLVLSLDVIFHLVEDETFERYMKRLFNISTHLVLIYSSNFDNMNAASHVRHRKYTKWIHKNAKQFNLIDTWQNPFPFTKNSNPNDTSFSEFKLFSSKDN